MNPQLPETVSRRHLDNYGQLPQYLAYAPGRIEILGNHTDYNGGLTISAAIDTGICVAVSCKDQPHADLLALDLGEQASFKLPAIKPDRDGKTPVWANYIMGVTAGLTVGAGKNGGFDMTFSGDIPRGAGLSSSAALEVAAAMALAAMSGVRKSLLDLARICQRAENEFAGAQCGLLDQLSVLHGREDTLTTIDFQTLTVGNIPLPQACVFLVVNTGVHHSLVECAYNDRRAQCEAATAFFKGVLRRPIPDLRAVSAAELDKYAVEMEPVVVRRAAHVIGENRRVEDGIAALGGGNLEEFGRLMFASHESSRVNFENSCPELDFIVNQARALPPVIGARLSGGGFGGSAVIMTEPDAAEPVAAAIRPAFQHRFGHACEIRAIKASAGATLLRTTHQVQKS